MTRAATFTGDFGLDPLVLDSSVAVKFYVREEFHQEALDLLAAAESGVVELVAPSTLQSEFFNALWWKHRRSELSQDEVRRVVSWQPTRTLWPSFGGARCRRSLLPRLLLAFVLLFGSPGHLRRSF